MSHSVHYIQWLTVLNFPEGPALTGSLRLWEPGTIRTHLGNATGIKLTLTVQLAQIDNGALPVTVLSIMELNPKSHPLAEYYGASVELPLGKYY